MQNWGEWWRDHWQKREDERPECQPWLSFKVLQKRGAKGVDSEHYMDARLKEERQSTA